MGHMAMAIPSRLFLLACVLLLIATPLDALVLPKTGGPMRRGDETIMQGKAHGTTATGCDFRTCARASVSCAAWMLLTVTIIVRDPKRKPRKKMATQS